MAKTIGIFAEYTHERSGPQKVLENLWRGLELLGIHPKFNELGDYNVCLQHWSRYVNHLPAKNTLFGPNANPPWMLPDLYARFNHFLCPSQWIYDAFAPYLPQNSLYIWPVGIDTDKFKPSACPKDKVLIYYKNRPQEELEILKNSLEEWGVKYILLEYGKYSEEQLIEAANQCYCGILLTNTESQGIAYMEILSMNVPLYCFNVNQWVYDKDHIVYADSAPYLVGGIKDNHIPVFKSDLLKSFIKDPYFYYPQPRNYIVQNHSLEQGAIDLINIFEKAFNGI